MCDGFHCIVSLVFRLQLTDVAVIGEIDYIYSQFSAISQSVRMYGV